MALATHRLRPPHFRIQGPAAEQFRLSGKAVAGIVLYGASLLLGSLLLGNGRVLSHHEVLFAQPAKEMLATGNWIVPTIAGVPSTHKPPGTHWLIALSMALTGSTREAVVRLPAVLGGIVTALLVGALAARWLGRRAGWVAGLMQLTTYYGLRLARTAEAEILLTAAVCGAMCCFMLANVESPRGRASQRWLPWLFYLAAGVSFLFKGLVGPVFIFSGCGLFVLVSRDRRGARFLLSPVGVGIFLACTLGWSIAAYWQYPPFLDDQIQHHFGRMEGELGGAKDPFFYLYSIPFVVLPWTPLVILAVVRGIRRRQDREPLWRFLACWVLPGLVVLCISTFKRDHYLAPLMPPLTILGAGGLIAFVERPGRRSTSYLLLGAAAIVIGSAAGVIAVERLQPKGVHEIAALIGLLGAAMLVTNYLECFHGPRAHLAAMLAMVWLVAVGALSFVVPHYDSYADQTELAGRVNGLVPEGATIHLVGLKENQITYYLPEPLVRVDDPADFAARLPSGHDEVYVVAPQRVGEGLAQFGSIETLDRCPTVRWYLQERGRLTLFRFNHRETATAAAARTLR